MPELEEITDLLREVGEGREGAMNRLMDRVYGDLKAMARNRLQRSLGPGRRDITLDTTALVNETYLRLIKQRKRYDNGGQFFAVASRVMLRVLLDYQRARQAQKRFGGQIRISLGGVAAEAARPPDAGVTILDRALGRLEELDPRGAEIVKLRVLWGLTLDEIAAALGVSRSTVDREWRFVRRWLAVELGSAREKG